ncbi:heat-inducible transcriptional repressor HrcA [Synechococcus sp. MIT S9451]|uniref:heat-inducible transcriptional repressor HrcA n=1 Tax=Synechococcus sp. MIT S9451 TaxID=3082543 RepID=UPI0039B6314B
MEPLPSRQQEVLRATVHHYVDTIEPVGSRTLVKRFGLKASSATVRYAMGALEQRGLLTQPHTSAGRVPSPRGYRHYVDCLLPPPGAAAQHLEQELTQLSLRWAALDDLLQQMARRLTDFTGLMSLITHPTRLQPALEALRLVRSEERLLVMLVQNSSQASHLNLRLPHGSEHQIEAIELWTRRQLEHNGNGQIAWESLPLELQDCGRALQDAIHSHQQLETPQESRSVFHGVSRLIAEPEFSQSSRVRPLLELMDEQPTALAPSHCHPCGGVWIGQEHPQTALHQCSVVQAPYRSGGEGIGQVALVGPMRMAYATALAAVQSVARTLERLLS